MARARIVAPRMARPGRELMTTSRTALVLRGSRHTLQVMNSGVYTPILPKSAATSTRAEAPLLCPLTVPAGR